MKILIVKTSSLGDIVHTFPVVSFLKNKFPHAQIDWVVEKPYVDLVRAHPFVDRVIPIQTKKWRSGLLKKECWKELKSFYVDLRRDIYDVVFDLQGNIKSGFVTAASQSHNKVGFGRPTVAEWPNTFFTNRRFNPPSGQNIRVDYLFLVQSFFLDFSSFEDKGICLKTSPTEQTYLQSILAAPQLQSGMKVMVCPGSNWANKQISTECLTSFLKQMTSECRGHYLFLWGTQDEKAVAEKLHEQFLANSILMERISLPALQNLMSDVDLVIAMDSLPLHLAATTGTPTFSVFGASSANKYKPVGSRHMAYQGPCPYGKIFIKRCPILRTCPTGACIKDINSTHLFNTFLSWWKSL